VSPITSSDATRCRPASQRLRAPGRRALIPYVTAGYPTPTSTAGCSTRWPAPAPTSSSWACRSATRSPTARRSSARRSPRSSAGSDAGGGRSICCRVPRPHDVPVVLFSYLNPIVLAYGVADFIAMPLQGAGVLLTDLPVGADDALEEALPGLAAVVHPPGRTDHAAAAGAADRGHGAGLPLLRRTHGRHGRAGRAAGGDARDESRRCGARRRCPWPSASACRRRRTPPSSLRGRWRDRRQRAHRCARRRRHRRGSGPAALHARGHGWRTRSPTTAESHARRRRLLAQPLFQLRVGSTKTVRTRSGSDEPGCALRGLRTYLRRVQSTGTVPDVRALLCSAASTAASDVARRRVLVTAGSSAG
jgi:hypothetical protein